MVIATHLFWENYSPFVSNITQSKLTGSSTAPASTNKSDLMDGQPIHHIHGSQPESPQNNFSKQGSGCHQSMNQSDYKTVGQGGTFRS